MLKKTEMLEAITNKIINFEKRQFKLAFGKGTEKAWKNYEKEMEKFRSFINSEISAWNEKNTMDPIDEFTKEDYWYWLNKTIR